MAFDPWSVKINLKRLFYLFGFFIAVIGCKNCKTSYIRPNVLFVLVDDQRYDVLSCAGHPIIETPAVDKLAEEGIRFTNAFVTTSICAASRASIFTGLYEYKHNYTFGKAPLKKELVVNSYPYLLRQAGYNTGFVGKFGVKVAEQDSMLAEMFDYYRMSPRNAPYFEKLADGTRRHSAEIKGDQAVEYIHMQSKDQPFCLSISFNAVHAVDDNLTPGNEGHYPYPSAVEQMYESIEMPEPDLNDPQIFENHPDFMKNSMNRVRYYWRWDTDEKYEVNMRAYYRMISGCDNVMKRVIGALREKGFDKNTVVIYSADNGYYLGNRGFAGKWSHYEESLRVPMIIYDPRAPQKTAGTTSDKVALNIDIPATILDCAGIEVPELYQGRSLLAVVSNENIRDWPTSFLCEHRMDHDQIPKFVGIRGERYVYANYYEQEPPYEYLHDLQTDPDQLVNFAKDPDYSQVLEDMREKCKIMERN
ncbi:MAG: sulfatase [Cytophagales bacterium]|nr:sulfatase [Cytophagales bacterium]